MELSEHIQNLIEPAIGEMGFNIVRVRISGKKKLSMQVMVEHQDGQGMMVDDCVAVSRAISALLDVEDPIDAPYTLEVSSPGIDRPLTRRQDFTDWSGHEARIVLTEAIDGQKQFKGELEGIDGDDLIAIRHPRTQDIAQVPFALIADAKLVLTDKLIAATVPLSMDGADEEILDTSATADEEEDIH